MAKPMKSAQNVASEPVAPEGVLEEHVGRPEARLRALR